MSLTDISQEIHHHTYTNDGGNQNDARLEMLHPRISTHFERAFLKVTRVLLHSLGLGRDVIELLATCQ